jgi:NACHT domain
LYFLFNHSNREQKAEDVIRILLKQLVKQLPIIPIDVENEYNRYQKDPHNVMPSQEKFQSLLNSSIQDYFARTSNRAFILIDAYDEFRNCPEEEESERTYLRSCLQQLCAADMARVFITTRPQHRDTMQETFPGAQMVEIHGDLKDIEKYLENRLQHFKAQPAMKERIKSAIMDENQTEAWFHPLQRLFSSVLGFCSQRSK